MLSIGTAHIAAATEAQPSAADAPRQALEDAWWTGPVLAAGASTLPPGHFLIEPYFYDVVTYGRYDEGGTQRSTRDVHSYGSSTYVLYGFAEGFTAGLIPRFGYNDVPAGRDSSGVGVADMTVQAQYRLTQFREGRRVPTISFVAQETLPNADYDRLGDRPSEGLGSGAYTTTLALFSQYYLWMPNGRILRTRLNFSYSFSDEARVEDVSVYGTPQGFRGRAEPGDSLQIISAWEYSLTRNWVLAFDLYYQHDDATHVRGFRDDGGGDREPVVYQSRAGWRFGVVPAIEYNFNSQVGVIFGARWVATGRNTDATITPVVAINIVY